jgi:hypothetical protein
LLAEYSTWNLWSLKAYIKDMQRTDFRLAIVWLICISETSDLIQSSAVHWESAYMCTKLSYNKDMSYSLFTECVYVPVYSYMKWNYEYCYCSYSIAMSLNIHSMSFGEVILFNDGSLNIKSCISYYKNKQFTKCLSRKL